ncbi:S8 family serine peptidase, partial [Priestia megaterium]|uniref:S8 family serine peptidase n=1 Tax=Priestia megaterium TaxID=1404 RepID=UPI00300056CB
VFNGVSLQVPKNKNDELRSLPGVKAVYPDQVYHADLADSVPLIGAPDVWSKHDQNNQGITGKGVTVAVIDTGVDYNHPDLGEGFGQGHKVVGGYDFVNHDNDPMDDYGHGTHVAGIIAAHGKVTGVAPDASITAYKVLNQDGIGYTSDIIDGIEASISPDNPLGADVINMSLGTDSGFVSEVDDPIQKVIREATEQGTLVVVAGGNSAYSTQNNLLQSSLKPYAENPDIGTVGEPGVSPFALSVASYENSSIHMSTLKEENGLQLPYQDQSQYNFNLSKVLSPLESYELVYVGEGKTADFKNLPDLTGKIVVAKPNERYATYSYIQSEAKKKNAKAVILVPAADDIDYPLVYWSPYFNIQAVTT